MRKEDILTDLNNPDEVNLFDRFGSDHGRFDFPGPIYRVTGGHGGESILIIGSEKTLLIDCGMAYSGPVTVDNIKKVLNAVKDGEDPDKTGLDMILLSHSHYDHIGALPYIKEEFPEASVMASSHCASVLKRDGALKLIKELGENARDQYDPGSDLEIITDGFSVDRVLDEGDRLCIGEICGEEAYIEAMETPGHTNCSMSFYLMPLGLLFTSESTGILEGKDYCHTPCLKSFIQGLESLEKCRNRGAVHVCLPHYGMLPDHFIEEFWDMFVDECRSKTLFTYDLISKGIGEDEMLERYVKRYWTSAKEMEQPREAFELNSGYILGTLIKENDRLLEHFGISC